MRRLGVGLFLFWAIAVLVCANGADFAAASSSELLVAGDVVILSELPDYVVPEDATIPDAELLDIEPDADEPNPPAAAAAATMVAASECDIAAAPIRFTADAEASLSATQFVAAVCCGGFVVMLGAMVIAWRRRARLFAVRAAEYAAHAALEAELTTSQCESQWHIARCESLAREVDTREMQVDVASRNAEELQLLYESASENLRDAEARCTSLEQELGESRKQCETTQHAAEESRRASETVIESMREAERRRAKSGASPQKVWRTLDDIAFETSRLALEASMAAARAGTHGHNFTDVAHEIQSLARRTTHAARNATPR